MMSFTIVWKKWSLPNLWHRTYKRVTLTWENYWHLRLDVQMSRCALTPLVFTPLSWYSVLSMRQRVREAIPHSLQRCISQRIWRWYLLLPMMWPWTQTLRSVQHVGLLANHFTQTIRTMPFWQSCLNNSAVHCSSTGGTWQSTLRDMTSDT
jgi:hypothetical protein